MEDHFKELDVRPLLAAGGEPFAVIMAAVDGLKAGEGMKLIAPFNPVPLYTVMERKGFEGSAIERDDNAFEISFIRKRTEIMVSAGAGIVTWPDPVMELDLTALDPPEPMVRILAELEEMDVGEVLFAVLAREPVFLFPELTKRGHEWVGNYDKSGTAFRIMIRRG